MFMPKPKDLSPSKIEEPSAPSGIAGVELPLRIGEVYSTASLADATVIGSAEGTFRIALSGDPSGEGFTAWLDRVADRVDQALVGFKGVPGPDPATPVKPLD
jgi:hypothetical protein